MRDTEFYAQILGLTSPWFVERVGLDVKEQRVDVYVGHAAELRWKCPQCERELACRDHAPEREWRHLDTCQMRTFLHGRIPRVECPEHGVVQVSVPWAGPRSRFTLLFERFAIDVIRACANIRAAQQLLRISWDECDGIMERAVVRGLARKKRQIIPLISVDEKAIARRHRYMTIVSDFVNATVEHIEEGRSRESLASFWEGLTPEQLAGIVAISMDMWEPYVDATKEHVPCAQDKIVFDRYHVMRHAVDAVDLVRRRENRELTAAGDERLKKTKYLWLFNEENVPEKHREAFAALRSSTLKVARAWALKEDLRELWRYRSSSWARRFFTQWFGWATRSKLPPMREVAKMIRRHLHGVVNYCRFRLTNSVAEGINAKISAVQKRACGFRNPERFKTAVYFFCGGLDLYPR